MWKDTYLVGVELIDNQHKELFRRVEKLLAVIGKSDANYKEECEAAVAFLKNYTVEHFGAEEAYQESINYDGLEEHKKIHKLFIDAIDFHEKQMVESDFAAPYVQAFAGMLTAWLINHIGDEDQQIPKGNRKEHEVSGTDFSDILLNSTKEAFSRVAGTSGDFKMESATDEISGDLIIRMDINDGVHEAVEFVFPKEIALKLTGSMKGGEQSELDDYVNGALSEIVNIISKKSKVAPPPSGTNVYSRPTHIKSYNLASSGTNIYAKLASEVVQRYKISMDFGDLGINVYNK